MLVKGRAGHDSFTYPLCCRFPTKMHALNRSRSSPRWLNHCPGVVVSRLDSSTNTSTATNEMEWHTDGGSIHAGGRNLPPSSIVALVILNYVPALWPLRLLRRGGRGDGRRNNHLPLSIRMIRLHVPRELFFAGRGHPQKHFETGRPGPAYLLCTTVWWGK